MARPASPTVRRRELAATLRRHRLSAGLTLDDAARHIEMSAATLSRIETGVRIPRARDVRDLLKLYGLTDGAELDGMVGLVAEAKQSGWWEGYADLPEQYSTLIGLEAAATRLQEYHGAFLPGLLQTAEYARALLRDAVNLGRAVQWSERDIEGRVEIRMRRQDIVLAEPGVPFEAILDEGALRRRVGGAQVMSSQLLRLAALTELPHLSIRVLPFDLGAHPGQPGPFTIVTLPQEAVADVVYVDMLAGQFFLEGERDLERYRRVWQQLHDVALDKQQSVAVLHRLASEL